MYIFKIIILDKFLAIFWLRYIKSNCKKLKRKNISYKNCIIIKKN